MQFSSIQPIDRALSGAILPGQSGSRSNDNEGVLHIHQSPSITGISLSDCIVSYPGHLLGGALTPSTALANWAIPNLVVLHQTIRQSMNDRQLSL